MNGVPEQAAKAERLRELHSGPRILVLPNAWDVASAKVFARHASCQAIATTSAGVAASLGYPDGEHVPREEMLEAVGRIASAVAVPVTADLEAGYGDAAGTARAAVAAGAVGLNIEDGRGGRSERLVAVGRQTAEIAAIRASGEESGVRLVVNARTDVFLREVGDPSGRLARAVERANAYLAAGADCAFVPGVADAELIERLVEAIDGPLNVLAGAGTPPVVELERLGVARVSVGSRPMRATLALARRMSAELLERGGYAFAEDALSFGELAALFER